VKRRPPSPILYLIDSYNFFLVAYVILRFIAGSRWWWLGLLHTFALWLFLPLILLIMLAMVLRGKRRAGLSFLLLLVGLLQFAPLPVGYLSASDEPHDLRVLTFNTWAINPQFEDSLDWVLAQDADVLILQEMVGSHLDHIPEILALYPHQAYVEGNVQVFSRYPFVESEVIWIEDAAALREGRLAVRTVIDFNGQPITVYGVHLTLPVREDPHFNLRTGIDTLDFILHYDETRRNAQILNLVERIQTESNPVIVAGDFNTSHTSPILNHFTDIGMTDAFRVVGADWGMTWSHNPPELPLIRIDYVWSSDELTPLRIRRGDFIGSDHLPVVVDFAVR